LFACDGHLQNLWEWGMPMTAVSTSASGFVGDIKSFPVPLTELDRLRSSGKTAVIIGAGPGGLMAALTIKEAGYENVIVLEKRTSFTRNNIVNLHPEARHIFKRLNILDRFLARASLIVDHRNHIFLDGKALFDFRDQGTDVETNADHSFEASDVLNGFRNETAFSISLADLQDFLALVACERGITIVRGADATVSEADDGLYSVRANMLGSSLFLVVEQPDVVVVAEGASGALCRQLGGGYRETASLWPEECWVFGNYPCRVNYAYSHLLFEFSGGWDDLTISNCIFLPQRQEVNVAVTVKRADLTQGEIRDRIAEQARKILRISGAEPTSDRVTWHSHHVVRIVPKSAERCYFGKNVVLLGDAMGANSPVAALGGTLSTSAYSYAIRHLIQDLELLPAEDALAAYGRRARSYVTRWHNKVNEVRSTLERDIRMRGQATVRAAGDTRYQMGGEA